jgi:hypothetical protein
MSTPRSSESPWVVELVEDDRPLVHREREQLHIVGNVPLEPVGENLIAVSTDEAGQVLDGLGEDGDAGEHHPPQSAIDIDEWVEAWLPNLERDRRRVSVFQTPEDEGVSVGPERLKRDLEEKLAEFEL